MKATIILSKHAKKRMNERKITSLPLQDVRIYTDRFDKLKFYLNIRTDVKKGFLVLVKVGKHKYVVKTITKRGKIDDRSFVFYEGVVVQ